MRGCWALIPLLASSGCLYLDGLNHAPSIEIADGITSTNRGGTLTVHAMVNDPEDGPNGVKVTYEIFRAGSMVPLDAQCDYDKNQFGTDLSVRIFRPGIYEVRATVDDPEHAEAKASVMVTITDAPPAFADKSMIIRTSTPNACNLNAAGDVVTLKLDGSVSDPDMTPLGCPSAETLSYQWRISDWPGGAKPMLTAFDGLGCPSPTAESGTTLVVPNATTQVCLWTDPALVGGTAMYSVVLDVSDGTSTVSSPVGGVTVSADEPPCITGTEPVAGSYVVDRSELQTFLVDGSVDDRDHFNDGSISYVWSVRRDTDVAWSEVPSHSLSSYTLDPSSFGPARSCTCASRRSIALWRACPRRPARRRSSDCVVSSCAALPDVCHKWKTWDLELR